MSENNKAVVLTEPDKPEPVLSDYELIENLANRKQRRFLLTLIQSISLRAAIKACKMGMQSHYIWNKDPKYHEAFEAASRMRWKTLEDDCIERAVTDKKDKLLTIFLLKGAYPERYRDNYPIQLFVSGPSQIFVTFANKSDEIEIINQQETESQPS